SKGRVRRSGMKSRGIAGKEAPYKGAQDKKASYKGTQIKETPRKSGESKEPRFKGARTTDKGALAKPGRYKDAQSVEKAPYKGAPAEVGRLKAERSITIPYKSAQGKAGIRKHRGGKKDFL
ncbi:MAG: hypothetical protein WA125_09120, partial [Desulfosporosinus sp.]